MSKVMCTDCEGAGYLLVGAEKVECAPCEGMGEVPEESVVTRDARAKWLRNFGPRPRDPGRGLRPMPEHFTVSQERLYREDQRFREMIDQAYQMFALTIDRIEQWALSETALREKARRVRRGVLGDDT